MVKPIKSLELHYPMIQFLIITIINLLFIFYGKNGSIKIICRHDEFVLTQKLDLVLQNLLIELMACKISLRNGANLSQSVLNEMHYSNYGMCENERSTDLCFEAKQIHFAPEFHRIIWRINVLLQIINIHEKLGPEKQVQVIEVQIIEVWLYVEARITLRVRILARSAKEDLSWSFQVQLWLSNLASKRKSGC